MAKSDEQSTLSKMTEAAANGAASPSTGAKLVGGKLAPPGAGEAVAQGLQAGANAAVAGSKGFMEATIRQHGKGPAAVLNEMQIKQALDKNAQPGQNKGIEAARQKAAAKTTESGKSQSTNKGIESYQSKASGESTGSSRSTASSSAKGSSASSGKSGGSSSGSGQSSGGQGR